MAATVLRLAYRSTSRLHKCCVIKRISLYYATEINPFSTCFIPLGTNLCVSLTENPTVLARREVSFRRMMAQCWTWPVAIKESCRRLWSWFILQLLSELQHNRSKSWPFPHFEPLKTTALSSPQNAKSTDGGRVGRRRNGFWKFHRRIKQQTQTAFTNIFL